jgi:hypothetical protein
MTQAFAEFGLALSPFGECECVNPSCSKGRLNAITGRCGSVRLFNASTETLANMFQLVALPRHAAACPLHFGHGFLQAGIAFRTNIFFLLGWHTQEVGRLRGHRQLITVETSPHLGSGLCLDKLSLETHGTVWLDCVISLPCPRRERETWREPPPIAAFSDLKNYRGTMTTSLVQIARQRENLTQELSIVRRASLQASRNDDFRSVARLTLEAARINRSIAEADVQADLVR